MTYVAYVDAYALRGGAAGHRILCRSSFIPTPPFWRSGLIRFSLSAMAWHSRQIVALII